MDKYVTNSDKKSKEPSSRNIESVVSSQVQVKQKSAVKKLKESMFASDLKTVGKYVVSEYLGPSLKKMGLDIIRNGAEMLIMGEVKKSTNGNHIQYNKISEESRRPYANNSRYSIDDIVLDSMGEAQMVLDKMQDIIDEFDSVTVLDFYELVGLKGKYTDAKYGWKHLNGACVSRVSEGYILDLPRIRLLD